MVKFFIEQEPEEHVDWIRYLLTTWAKNQGTEIVFSDGADGAISIGRSEQNLLQLTDSFKNNAGPELDDNCFFKNNKGKPDYLSTAFHMINSMQEHDNRDLDDLNRFRFKNSYQCRFRNSKDNIVQNCFSEISKIAGITPRKEKTKFFLSHDIDIVYGAILEDGFNVLKKGRIDIFFNMLFKLALGKPAWLNIDQIMKIESEYDCKSTFFWIVNQGKINNRERNADYSFQSEKIQTPFNEIEREGFGSGIHKSISSETFEQEFVKFKKQPFSNRYHYLKFNLPKAYHDIDDAGLKLDASLGFAEEIGFRNSYGLPFNPYNFKSKKAFSFVEVPLHVMDRTYFQYKKFSVEKAQNDIFDFFEKNRENSVISVLWHNNFFTNYKFKGYPELYKRILLYIRENDFGTISQEEIVKKYSIV